ncbi:inositol polyphosphate kinase [Toxoplasma gondii GAB2-2007-GAL-DOM2]|uniref:Inositol polyphosphate kinase n=2 Tax=Toxoplasma gondii TaxID=5811 RepID=A0A086LD03_TOXGO|nr:inositol polyphosphate kinase [Toxoplasma gondii GAB2-2007-GAL-DOM2]KFG54521.1 inositol polyphosphate kinase [Toxoplasma gondii FOU]
MRLSQQTTMTPAATATPRPETVGVSGHRTQRRQQGVSPRSPKSRLDREIPQILASSFPGCAASASSPAALEKSAAVAVSSHEHERDRRGSLEPRVQDTSRGVGDRATDLPRCRRLDSDTGGPRDNAVCDPGYTCTTCEVKDYESVSSPSLFSFEFPSVSSAVSDSSSAVSFSSTAVASNGPSSFSSSSSFSVGCSSSSCSSAASPISSSYSTLCPSSKIASFIVSPSSSSHSLISLQTAVASCDSLSDALPSAVAEARPPSVDACDGSSGDLLHAEASAASDGRCQRISFVKTKGVPEPVREEKAREARDEEVDDRRGRRSPQKVDGEVISQGRSLSSTSLRCRPSRVPSPSRHSPSPPSDQAEPRQNARAETQELSAGKFESDQASARELPRRLTSTPAYADDRKASSLLDAPAENKAPSLHSPPILSSCSSSSPRHASSASDQEAQASRFSVGGRDGPRASPFSQSPGGSRSPRLPLPASCHLKSKSWLSSLGSAVQTSFVSPSFSCATTGEDEEMETEAPCTVLPPSLFARFADNFLPCFRKGPDRNRACSELVRHLQTGFAGKRRDFFAAAFWGPVPPVLLVPLELLCDPAAFAEQLFAFPSSRFARIPPLVDAEGYLYRYVPEYNVRELEFFQLVQLAYDRVCAGWSSARPAHGSPEKCTGQEAVKRLAIENEMGDDQLSIVVESDRRDDSPASPCRPHSASEPLQGRPHGRLSRSAGSARHDAQEETPRPFESFADWTAEEQLEALQNEVEKRQGTERQGRPTRAELAAQEDDGSPAAWVRRLVSKGRDAGAEVAQDVQRHLRRATSFFTTVSESFSRSGVSPPLFPSKESFEDSDADEEIVDCGATDLHSSASLSSPSSSPSSSRSASPLHSRASTDPRRKRRKSEAATGEQGNERDEAGAEGGERAVEEGEDEKEGAWGRVSAGRGRGRREDGKATRSDVEMNLKSEGSGSSADTRVAKAPAESWFSALPTHADFPLVGDRLDGLRSEVARRLSGLRSWTLSFQSEGASPQATGEAHGARENCLGLAHGPGDVVEPRSPRSLETRDDAAGSQGRPETQVREGATRNALFGPSHSSQSLSAPASPLSRHGREPQMEQQGCSFDERRPTAEPPVNGGPRDSASSATVADEPQDEARRLCLSLAFLKQNQLIPEFAGLARVRPGAVQLQDEQRRRLARVYAAEEARKSDLHEVEDRQGRRVAERPRTSATRQRPLPNPAFESAVDLAFSPFVFSPEALHACDDAREREEVGEPTTLWERLDDVREAGTRGCEEGIKRGGLLMLRLQFPLQQLSIPCVLQLKLGRSFLGSHAGDPAANVREVADSLDLTRRRLAVLRMRQRVKEALFGAYEPETATKLLTNLSPADVGLGDAAPFLSVEQLQNLFKSWRQEEKIQTTAQASLAFRLTYATFTEKSSQSRVFDGVRRVTFDRFQCAGMDASQALELLHRFLSLHRQVASVCVAKLSALIEWLRHEPFFLFYSTSLFLFVDLSDPVSSADCRWTSFAHAVRRQGQNLHTPPHETNERTAPEERFLGRQRDRGYTRLDEVNAGVVEGLETIRQVARDCLWGA